MFSEPFEPGRHLAYHRAMLCESARLSGYKRAIDATVRPDDVVADIGAGTGILAIFAAAAGASKVFAIEAADSIDLARALIAETAFVEVIELIQDASTNVDLPEVDVLITDTFGGFGFDEGMIASVADARSRWLREEGKIIPGRVRVSLFPLESQRHYRRSLFPTSVEGVDVSIFSEMSLNWVHRVRLDDAVQLSAPQVGIEIDSYEISDAHISIAIEFDITQPGRLHGIGGWFETELIPGISLTTATPDSTLGWNHTFFPMLEPVDVEVGSSVAVEIRTAANGTFFRWRISVDGEPGPDQSTLNAWPVSLEKLHALTGQGITRR